MKKLVFALALVVASSNSFANELNSSQTASASVVSTGSCRDSLNGAGLDIVQLKVKQLMSWDSTTGRIVLPACQKAIEKYFENFPETPTNVNFEVVDQTDQTGYAFGAAIGSSCQKDQYLGYLTSQCTVQPISQ